MTYATVGLIHISYSSMAYLFAKTSELFIHRLGSPKCVVAGIPGCSDMFVIKIIAM